jgi:hypothetical protein
MWLTGPDQATGWRLSTAILGIATVALLMLVAFKLFPFSSAVDSGWIFSGS